MTPLQVAGKAAEVCAAVSAVALTRRRPGHAPAAVALVALATRRAPDTAPRPFIGLSRPFEPSPEQVAVARAAYVAAQQQRPVDMEGDRGGINPGDPIPSESADAIRARFEAEADARSQAREEPYTGEPDEDRTQVYSGRGLRRATLLGGLAGAPERPRSSPTRTAEAFRKAHPSSPTLVSEGIAPPQAKRDTPTPTEPGASTLDARIERLWHEKLAAAQEAGKDARHCHGPLCMTGEHPVEACGCSCDACGLVLDLLVAAQREIKGRE